MEWMMIANLLLGIVVLGLVWWVYDLHKRTDEVQADWDDYHAFLVASSLRMNGPIGTTSNDANAGEILPDDESVALGGSVTSADYWSHQEKDTATDSGQRPT
jgi:hypothetical protein